MNNYNFIWRDQIVDMSKSKWNSIAHNGSIFKQYCFNEALFNSNLEDVSFYYLEVTNGGTIVALVPCFTYKVELEILAGSGIKSFANLCRKFNKNFLKPKLFVIGAPVATCENQVCLNLETVPTQDYKKLGNEICRQIDIKSKELKSKVTIVKEIPNNELIDFQSIFSDNFEYVQSLTNSFIPISQDNLYPLQLRKKYRHRLKRSVEKLSENGFTWRRVDDFSDLSSTMFDLYQNVWAKSKYKFEKLTPTFFSSLNEKLESNCFLLLCENQDEQIVCAELVIEDEHSLVPMYLGLGYETEFNADVYNSVIYYSVKEAEKMNKKWVVLGQTSYDVKAYNGAIFEKLHLGFTSYNSVIKFLIKKFIYLASEPFTKPKVNAYKEDVLKSESFQLKIQERLFE